MAQDEDPPPPVLRLVDELGEMRLGVDE